MNKAIIFLFFSIALTSCSSSTATDRSITKTVTETATRPYLATSLIPTETSLPPLPKGIFNPFPTPVGFEPPSILNLPDSIRTAFGTVLSNEIVEEQVVVDSTIGQMSFAVFWREGDIDLTLVQPDGKVRDSTDLDYTLPTKYRELYHMYPPQYGVWTMRIFGKSTPVSGIDYMVQVKATVATGLSFEFDKDEYISGDVIKLTGNITDSTSGTMKAPPGYIFGAIMQVTVEDPAKNKYQFTLYDDGLHEDDKANDGIYANTFDNTKISGAYNFYIQISGINNRDKQPFSREYFCTTVVH